MRLKNIGRLTRDKTTLERYLDATLAVNPTEEATMSEEERRLLERDLLDARVDAVKAFVNSNLDGVGRETIDFVSDIV